MKVSRAPAMEICSLVSVYVKAYASDYYILMYTYNNCKTLKLREPPKAINTTHKSKDIV